MSEKTHAARRAYVLIVVLALAWWAVWVGLFFTRAATRLDSPAARITVLVVPLLVGGVWPLHDIVGRRRSRTDDLPYYTPDLALIDGLNRAANVGEDRDRLLARLSEGAGAAFSSRGANVYLLDDAHEYLALLADPDPLLGSMGIPRPAEPARPRIRLADSTWYANALQSTEPILTNKLDDIVAMALEFEGSEPYATLLPTMLQMQGITSVMTVPICNQGQVSGLVDMSRGWPFTDQEVGRFRLICDQVALVLARIDVEGRLSKSETLYRTLTELTPDLIFVVDEDRRVVLANSAAARFVDKPLAQLNGAHITELFGPMGVQFEEYVSQVASTGQPLDSEDRLTVVKSEVWLKTTLVPLSEVAPGFVLGVSRDISDSKRLEVELRRHSDEVERLATHDTLTGLANRRAFMLALDHALALSRRGTPSAVLFMDIDSFKRCNDERGHAFGDKVLSTVAGMLASEAREVDLVARIGGDEFAALLANTDEPGAAVVAQRMRARVRDFGAEIGIPVDLSVGIAAVEPDSSSVHIIEAADQRMYEQKAAHHGGEKAPEETWPFRRPVADDEPLA